MLENNKSEIVNLIEALSLFLSMLKYNLHFPVNWSETMVMARNFGSDEQAFHVFCSFCVFIFCLLFLNQIFNLDYDCTTLCLYSTGLNTKFYKVTSNVLCAYHLHID